MAKHTGLEKVGSPESVLPVPVKVTVSLAAVYAPLFVQLPPTFIALLPLAANVVNASLTVRLPAMFSVAAVAVFTEDPEPDELVSFKFP